MPKLKTTDDQRRQSYRFIETARELGADEDEAAFKAKLAVIARQKPIAYEITRSQRKEIDAEVTATRPARTANDIRTELAAAEAELAGWQDKFGNYDGNNPNKYRTSIRLAALEVERLKSELARLVG